MSNSWGLLRGVTQKTNDDICHHKYMSKKLVNGRWVYQYDKNSDKSSFKYLTKKLINGKWRYYYDTKKTTSESQKKVDDLTERISKFNVKNESLESDISNIKNAASKAKTSATNTKNIINPKKEPFNPDLKKHSKSDYIKTKKDHKYVRKEFKNGKWVYYYDDETAELIGVPEDMTYEEKLEYLKKLEEWEKFPELKRLDPFEENWDDPKDINPEYYSDEYEKGAYYNCYSCAFTYEMRARGFDVESILDDSGNGLDNVTIRETLGLQGTPEDDPETFMKSYVGIRSRSLNTMTKYDRLYDYDPNVVDVGHGTYKLPSTDPEVSKAVEDEILKKFGRNARGVIVVKWAGYDAGHAVNLKVKNGKITIVDNQNGNISDVASYLSRVTDIEITRTDNLELPKDITKYVRNAR